MTLLLFKTWLRRRIAPLLLGVGAIILVSQILFSFTLFKGEREHQDNIANRFALLSVEAISTYQVQILDQMASIALDESGLKFAALCTSESEVQWSYPTFHQDCPLNKHFSDRFIERSLFSNKIYPRLILAFPLFPAPTIIFFILLSAGVIIFSGLFLLHTLRKRIYDDLYFPVSKFNDENVQFSIYELSEAHKNLLELRSREKENAISIALGKIATQVAHDIRGPLGSMKVALEGLVTVQAADPKYSSYLNILELASNRLQGTADGLLKKRGEGKEKEEVVLFSLHHILDELIGEYQTQEQYQRVIFKKEYLSQSIQLHGDPKKLQRAFGNIVKNAVEAMKGEGVITLRTSLHEGRVTISITDNGPGMAPETLEKVLKGGYTEGKQDGHGIGTQVVREVVNEFHGELTAESTLDQGTTFHLTFPLPSQDLVSTATRDDSAQEAFEIKVESISPSPNPLPPGGEGMPLVLVVDDDPSLREAWRMILEDQEITAILCENYEEIESILVGDNGPLRSPSSAPTGAHDGRSDRPVEVTTAIVDYHYDNSVHNGIDVLRYLQTKQFKHLYLCTAEYWKPDVKRLAEELNIQICPKPLPKITVTKISPPSVSAPIEGEGIRKGTFNGHGLSVLVIDDDPGIHLSWKVRMDILKISELKTYTNMEACTSNGMIYDNIDIAFIDKNVEGSGWSLERTIRYLKDKGIPKIIIATGELANDLKDDPICNLADGVAKEKIPNNIEMFVL